MSEVDVGLKYEQNSIQKIPKNWNKVCLVDIIHKIYYGITAKATEKNTGIRMLRTSDIRNYSFDWENLPFCEITEKRKNLDKYFLRRGDLIVTRAGTVGISVFVERNFDNTVFGSYLIKIEPKPDMNSRFLHYFFQSNMYWKHLQKVQGSTLKNLNLPLLRSLQILLPTPPEQEKIVEILSVADDVIQKADEAIAKNKRLKKGLMQELLTKGIILGFMLDTTLFNDILNRKIDINRFPKHFDYFITFRQLDELNETPDPNLREKLKQIFVNIDKEEIPTKSSVNDVSGFDKAKLGKGEILDKLRKENLRNIEDALIGETAIMNGLILVTDDKELLRKVRELGGWAITLKDFLNENYREFNETEIGRIPRHWDVVELGKIADLQRGKFTHRPRNDPDLYGGEFPFIQTGDIGQIDGIIREYSQTLNEEGFKVSKLFKRGTIVISIAGNIGDVGILDFDSCFPDSVIGINANSKRVDSFFLMYLLQKYKHKLSSTAPRSTQKNINLRILNPFKLPLPPSPEQQKIAEILTTVDRKLILETKRKEKLERIKKGLMNDLLTGKIRVKIS